MTTKTRKAPTGAKHDRCIGHVEHPYPSKGMLCYGEVIGRDGMVEFADHLAKTRAEHRAAFLAEPLPDGSRVRLADATNVCRDVKKCGFGTGGTIHLHPVNGAQHVRRSLADAAALAELVARFRAMRGMPAIETPAPVKVARGPIRKVQPADDTYAAAVARVTAETPGAVLVIAEPVSDQRTEWVEPSPIVEPEPILSAPAPVLTILQPVQRPTCERCGQVFRVKGSGAEWHRVNRPDCARVAVAV